MTPSSPIWIFSIVLGALPLTFASETVKPVPSWVSLDRSRSSDAPPGTGIVIESTAPVSLPVVVSKVRLAEASAPPV